MSSIISRTFDNFPIRRFADIGQGFGGGGTSALFSAFGDDLTDGPTDGRTGTNSRVIDTDGARTAINTVGVNGDYNHIYGIASWRRNLEPNFYCRFKNPASSLSSLRFFIGLTDLDPSTMLASNMAAGSSPVGNYCGLWKDSASSSIKFIGNNNTSTAEVFSVQTIDTVVHDFFMWLKKSGGGDNVMFQLDNQQYYDGMIKIPPATTDMQYMVGVKTLTAAIRTIEIGKIHIDQVY